jgi:hypothetical protein
LAGSKESRAAPRKIGVLFEPFGRSREAPGGSSSSRRGPKRIEMSNISKAAPANKRAGQLFVAAVLGLDPRLIGFPARSVHFGPAVLFSDRAAVSLEARGRRSRRKIDREAAPTRASGPRSGRSASEKRGPVRWTDDRPDSEQQPTVDARPAAEIARPPGEATTESVQEPSSADSIASKLSAGASPKVRAKGICSRAAAT